MPPLLIGLDWGTSSLRAMLIGADGVVLEEAARPWGITRLPPGGFVAAYDEVTAAWRAAWPALPCLGCGMVGSRQGWVEAPYCEAPAGHGARGGTVHRAGDRADGRAARRDARRGNAGGRRAGRR
jgi:2-dehydro-3-deoxygalactonokinase